MIDPKVNIVLTTYNHDKYIIECIDSIFNQTYRAINVVYVVDDNSSDNTFERLSSLRYDKLKVIKNSRNRGVSASANIGMTLGAEWCVPYIALMSGDDAWEPQKLEQQISFMEENGRYDLTFTDSIGLDDASNKLPKLPIFETLNRNRYEWMLRLFVGNCLLAPSAVMKRTVWQVAGPFNPILRQVQDWEFWIKALCSGLEWHVLQEPLTRYRTLTTSISNEMSTAKASRDFFENSICLQAFRRLPLSDFKIVFGQFIADSSLFHETQSVDVGLAVSASKMDSLVHHRLAAVLMCEYVTKHGNDFITDRMYHDFIGSLRFFNCH